MQLNCDFPAHHSFHHSHTLNVESLHEATQKHVQALYLNYIRGRLTHEKLKPSHHYSLTICVCPGKGAVQEEQQKQIMPCEMTNTLQLTINMYISN